jgi:hypothetical protein
MKGLGTWTRQDRFYGSESGYSLIADGELAIVADR